MGNVYLFFKGKIVRKYKDKKLAKLDIKEDIILYSIHRLKSDGTKWYKLKI